MRQITSEVLMGTLVLAANPFTFGQFLLVLAAVFVVVSGIAISVDWCWPACPPDAR